MSSSSLCFFLILLSLRTVSLSSLKQCIHSLPTNSGKMLQVRKVNIGESCSKDDISVYQSSTGPLPNGIPTYTVHVVNGCTSSEYTLSDVHVKCEAFASYHLINPRVFRRVAHDDCLVKNGEPLSPGEVVTFVYSNTFCYPLRVSSVICS